MISMKFIISGKTVSYTHLPMRNVKILQDGSFEESAHPSFCGSLDMEAVMTAYYDIGYTGYMSCLLYTSRCV